MPATSSGLMYRVNYRLDRNCNPLRRVPHSITIYGRNLFVDQLNELFFELDKLDMRYGEIAENGKSLNMRLYPMHP